MRFAGVALLAILLGGSLGAPFHRDEVPFEAIERENFDALAVVRERGASSTEPLVVRVRFLGDGADVDLTQARVWLLDHANVILARDPDGAPLYLTLGDLSATSGRSTLGATVPQGMAVEAGNVALANCVATHELLHFLGLTHVRDEGNVMHPQCTTTRLLYADLTEDQRAKLDGLSAIVATTPRGVETWASRG